MKEDVEESAWRLRCMLDAVVQSVGKDSMDGRAGGQTRGGRG